MHGDYAQGVWVVEKSTPARVPALGCRQAGQVAAACWRRAGPDSRVAVAQWLGRAHVTRSSKRDGRW